jgi:hypothetical protein
MKTDRIFVLLLVVLLPLSGCFDGSTTGDAEAQDGVSEDTNEDGTSSSNTGTPAVVALNLPPVISVETIGYLANVEGSDCTTNAFEIEVRHAMTDWDGTIVNAGWDINLDGIIDFPVTSSEGYMMIQIPMNSMLNRTAETGNGFSTYVYEYREQSIVFGAQDDDGEWTSSGLIKLSKTISSTPTNTGVATSYLDLEPCNDFTDVTDYNFSIVDHADIASTGNADYLVEITRTNGQAGLDWSRIRIVFDGDNEGDEVCSTSTQYRCQILGGTSLWEAGDTITLQESSDLHRGQQDAQVEIYIDNILVESLTLTLG